MTDKPFLTTERFELWLPRTADMSAMEIVLAPLTGRFLGARAGSTTMLHASCAMPAAGISAATGR